MGTIDYDGISEVAIVERSQRYYADYSERPTHYKVKLTGETRWRRVYIGHEGWFYVKILGEPIYCEAALEAALHR